MAKSNKYDSGSKDEGSEPRVEPNSSSCGICGELFKDCDGHMLELPGMHRGRQRD